MAEANAIGAGRNNLGEGSSQHRLAVHIYRNDTARIEKRNGDKSAVPLHHGLWQELGYHHELFLGIRRDQEGLKIWVKE